MAASTSPFRALPSTLSTPAALRSAAPARCIVLLPLSPPTPTCVSDSRKGVAYRECRKTTRNVIAMAVGETITPAETATEETPPPEETAAIETSSPADPTVEAATESLEMVKSMLNLWDKLDDKYAVSSLALAGFVGLYGTVGFVSAIDKIPLLPELFELVGIGYTGWFAYRNLFLKSNREALLSKIKCTYQDIITFRS